MSVHVHVRGLKLLLVVGVLLLGACGPDAGRFTGPVARAERMTLYEGLPHQGFEYEAMEAERRTKPVRELDGYTFYRDPLAPSDEDARRLATLLSAPGTFERFSGEKKCGGFHPDYAVEWQSDGSAYRALICFGCHETMLFGAGIDQRHDLDERAFTELEALLSKYRKHRPERGR